MTVSDFITQPLPEVAQSLATGEVSALALTEAYLDRIASLNPERQAYTTVTTETAIAQAIARDKARAAGAPLGPLHGVPIALKDLCETDFAPTSNGMAIFRDRNTGRNAELVDRLIAAGAVILGKLAMAEGACSTHHPQMPVPINPRGRNFRVGSSSSGSGVAVAAGLAAATIGSDTGGSIRFPSAYCGVTGLKTSRGLVSTNGVFPMAPSLDHVGPMAQTAGGCRLVLQGMLGDNSTPAIRPTVGRRLGYVPHLLSEGLDAEVATAYRQLLDAAVATGLELVACDLPDIPDMHDLWARLCAKEVAIGHASTYAQHQSEYGNALAAMVEQGLTISDEQHALDRKRQAHITADWQLVFETVDWLALPIHAIVPPLLDNALGAPNTGIGNPLLFTAPANVTGLPSLALPVGLDSRGCPIGMQIMGPRLSDYALLDLGATLQATSLPPLGICS